MRLVSPALDPSPVCRLADGSLFSERFGDIYASASGAVEQARHVFLDGTDLLRRCQGARSHTIVETGFGAGINFLATWKAWRAAVPADARLHYVSVEKHPFMREALREIHRGCPYLDTLSRALLHNYPPLVAGFHRLNLDDGRVTLTLLFGDAVEQLSQMDARADTFFLDGFAPAKNPEMWSDNVFTQLARLAADGARASSYTVAATVRAGLEKAGFAVGKRRGFGPKREMLVAQFRGGRPKRKSDRSVIVVGGGLAGTACAHRLSARGIDLALFERHQTVGREASGNPTGILRPHVGIDWIPQVELSLSAFLYSVRTLNGLPVQPTQSRFEHLDGVVHVAVDPVRNEKIAVTLAQMGMPCDVVRALSAREARDLSGVPVAGGGWFYEKGGWVDPAALCEAQLMRAGSRIEKRFGRTIDSIRRVENGWQVLDNQGVVLGEAARLVVANAHDALKLEQCSRMPIRPVRGQLTYVGEELPLLRAVCGDGYITPAVNGTHCIGASYNEGLVDTELRDEDHADNLRRLRRLLPAFCPAGRPLGGRVSFRTMSADLLPVCGELAPGLHTFLALGSRGIALAPLLAEAIASAMEEEPSPIPRSLAQGIHPGRFESLASLE